MIISFRDTEPPAAEPVTVALAKQHLKVDYDYEDELIGIYIAAARELCEKVTRRAFFERPMLVTLDHFPLDLSSTLKPGEWHPYLDVWERWAIRLPRPRCVSVQSIKYQDASGNPQTIPAAQYAVDTESEPARIAPTQPFMWPYVANYVPGTIQVAYTAGSYGDGKEENTCPSAIVSAILLIVGDLFKNRASTSELDIKKLPTVDDLLDEYKFFAFGFE